MVYRRRWPASRRVTGRTVSPQRAIVYVPRLVAGIAVLRRAFVHPVDMAGGTGHAGVSSC